MAPDDSQCGSVRTIPADRFKDICLTALDEVAATRKPVVITRGGKPIAQLVPYPSTDKMRSLAGSVLEETGDPYTTGVLWDADNDQIRATR